MFKLLRYFSIASLVAMGVVTVLLGIFYRHMALKDLMETEESKNIALTQVLANSIWPRFAPFLTSASALGREALRARPETTELRRAIIEQTKGLSVVKVKIYDLQGLTLFSTEAEQIGEDKSDNAGFLSARSGKVASELTHRNSFSAFDQIIEERDVFSSYIPIRGDPEGPIEGAFEVYTDLTPLMQRITRTQRTFMVGVVLIQACLYGVLFLIVRRADQWIQRHDIERSQKEEQIRNQLHRITALRQINVAVTSTLDIQAVLRVLMEKIAALLPFSTVQVWLLSRKDGKLERTACWNLDEEEWKRRSSRGTPPRVQAVIEGKKAVASANLQTDPRAVNSDFYRKHGLLSYLGVPLVVKGEVLGALAFFTKEERRFSQEEIEFLSTLAGQAAMAISNSQLYEETVQRARQQEVLNAIATAAGQSLDLNELFEIVLDKTVQVMGRKRINIRLKDPLTGAVDIVSHRGFLEKEIEELRRKTTHPTSKIFTSGTPLIINDHGIDGSPGLLERTRSVAWIPIKTGVKVVGVLGISDDQNKPFLPDEIKLLEAIGGVVGVAIENARLFGETKRNLEGIRALHEIDLAITSTLDLHGILDVLLVKIDLFLPYSIATVRLFNKENGLLEPVACRNVDEREWKAAPWMGDRGLANIAFETKSPVVVRNAKEDPRVRDVEFYRNNQLTSYLGLPLIVKDETLGVIGFYTREEHDFTGEEVEFLGALAGQAAIAIHNAQLYEATTTQAIQLAKSNQVKDEFLSVMSHELRTPLNVIIGYAGMLRDNVFGSLNPDQESAIAKVLGRSKDLLEMISSILQATQIEGGAINAEIVELDLNCLLDDLRTCYDTRLNGNVALKWDYLFQPPTIMTDGEKLKHILQNLINNAIKFTNQGSVHVHARYIPGQNEAEFKVADTGCGIPQESLPIIFEKFRQVDSSERRLHEGVGLGLYIVKQFTELLGGKVDVESEVGKGSTFIVTIPCSKIYSSQCGIAVNAPANDTVD